MKTRTTWLGALSAWSLAAAALSLQSNEAPPRVATRDDEFVQRVAADVLADVALGRLAAQRATRPEVKEFARTLADEQSRAYEELKALAIQKKFTLPSEPRPEQKAQIGQLEATHRRRVRRGLPGGDGCLARGGARGSSTRRRAPGATPTSRAGPPGCFRR